MSLGDNSSQPKPLSITIQLPPGPVINLTCFGFHLHADDFLAAARAYKPVARKASFVAQFLCCQSIELSLKAFLSLKGMSRKNLKRKFGHNLIRLLKRARKEGIESLVVINGNDESIVKTANAWYDVAGEKRLQYFSVVDAMRAFKDAPELAPLEDLAARLQSTQLREAVQNG